MDAGTGYAIISGGKLTPGVGGTSAAAPVLGGIISVVNSALGNAGRKPMGFLWSAGWGLVVPSSRTVQGLDHPVPSLEVFR